MKPKISEVKVYKPLEIILSEENTPVNLSAIILNVGEGIVKNSFPDVPKKTEDILDKLNEKNTLDTLKEKYHHLLVLKAKLIK